MLGAYWWPDALRRPIASVPKDEYPPDDAVHPSVAVQRMSFPLCLPDVPPWEPAIAICLGSDEVIVFLTHGAIPEPLHEMLLFEQGGLSLRAKASDFLA